MSGGSSPIRVAGKAAVMNRGSSLIQGTGKAAAMSRGSSPSGKAAVMGRGSSLILEAGKAAVMSRGSSLILGAGQAAVMGRGSSLIQKLFRWFDQVLTACQCRTMRPANFVYRRRTTLSGSSRDRSSQFVCLALERLPSGWKKPNSI